MNGWFGKILKIDISKKEYEYLTPCEDILHKYVGGKGLAGFYLKGFITREYDNPEMPLLFFTGPLVATPSPTSGRMTVMSRSPLTGTVGDTSVGGTFGTSLKRAGLDGIIITGKSENLCGIEINDKDVRFSDASSLKGLKIHEIHESLKTKGSTAVTGPAAEAGVMFSCIVIDGHYYAGRNGLGLIYASKNLKYVTVKGTQKTNIHDLQALLKAREDIFRLASASPILMGELGITHWGTAAVYDLMHNRRMMPTENFRKTYFEKARDMNAYAFNEKYDVEMTGCRGCHIQCKKKDKKGFALPEFETMSHFSALIGNDNLEAVTKANLICGETGMDTISAGATISCYQEISGKNLTPEQIVRLFEDIGYGRGEGRELGKGAYRYVESKDRLDTVMAVKKLELPAYDPRGAYGMALGFATSTRGGCHLRAYPISHEILRKPVATDRFSFSGKARIVKIAEDTNAIIDSLTACKFIFFAASLEEYAKAYTAVTGVESSAQDLLKMGERIYYNERIMNTKNGFTKHDDDLPARFFNEEGSSGNNIFIRPLDREEFLQKRTDYYKIRGLDEDGKPTREKCEELGLECGS